MKNQIEAALAPLIQKLQSESFPDKETQNAVLHVGEMVYRIRRQLAEACIRTVAKAAFDHNPRVASIVIEADWASSETDDHPYLPIAAFDESGIEIEDEEFLEHLDMQADAMQGVLWGVLDQHEFEGWLGKAVATRDGNLTLGSTPSTRLYFRG